MMGLLHELQYSEGTHIGSTMSYVFNKVVQAVTHHATTHEFAMNHHSITGGR